MPPELHASPPSIRWGSTKKKSLYRVLLDSVLLAGKTGDIDLDSEVDVY